MKALFKLSLHFIAIFTLTAITQIGGLIYILTLTLTKAYRLSKLSSLGLFLVGYLVFSLLILPIVAPAFGRTPLPLTGNLRPLNYLTCLLNRHYVRPQLKEQMEQIANRMEAKFDGTKTNYLDANFPFFDRFPLLPHLSHNDGKKLDLAFYYLQNNTRTDSAPSFIGYGVYDEPADGELDYPTMCREKGYFQYGLLSAFVPQWNKDDYKLDVERTVELISLLVEHQATGKVFIEPHLKERWHLNQLDKIRFHGCQAVRHDDHIHTQLQ
ncbi:conserved hypothetical protein [Imperialibacter sp. EC-SDR9]|nr:conserved hypothetical protein [Imperialibacter sp. 89]CAD5264890.1 conserved hypothetical protein [Imperialibacter sp. 75]VVT06533.1 conserved hypothetical protein [Imperialibacter sp. EC-SDR9]